MKVQWVLPVAIFASIAILGVMKLRNREREKVDKQNKFQEIKLRVSNDVLSEYRKESTEQVGQLQKAEADLKVLEEQVNTIQTQVQKTQGESDICQSTKKSTRDELASLETNEKNLQAEYDKEKSAWITETDSLKEKHSKRSAVCDFMKTKSATVIKLCGNDVIVLEPEKEEAKPVAPANDEAKVEAPKQEEAKAEPPK